MVKLEPTKCMVTVLGAWNAAIFTPDWVRETLPNHPTLRTEIALTDAGAAMKFTTDTAIVELIPGRIQTSVAEAVDLTTNDQRLAAFCAVEVVAKALLRALPVTPVRAYGTNFAMVVPESDLRFDFLRVPERAEIEHAGFNAGSTSVTRVLQRPGDATQLNLRIVQHGDGQALIDANFHRMASSATDVVAGVSVARDFSDLERLLLGAYTNERPT